MYLAENFTKRFNLERNESKLMNQITKFKRLEKDRSGMWPLNKLKFPELD